MTRKVENQLKSLNKNISLIVEFIQKLDKLSKTATRAGETIERSFKKSDKAMSESGNRALIVAENLLKLDRAANTLQQGILNANIGLSDQNEFLNQLTSSQAKAASRIQSFEGNIDDIREAFVEFGNETLEVNKILNDQKRVMKSTEETTRSEIKAVNDLTKEKVSRTVAESAALEKLKALQAEEGKLLSISGSQSTSVKEASEAYEKYIEVLQRTGSSSQETARAKAEFTARINDSRRLLRNSTTRMQEFNVASQNLTKSVQVALGPLSGVAARITALTALFNKNTASAAATIGVFTGLTVASRKLLTVGIEYERQMLRMEATTQSLGAASRFTTAELERMAQSLAESTLASVAQTRELVTVLNTFEGIAPEAFEKTAQAAIGMANVFGGAVETNARQLGRLLEDPLRNMDALRRTGIQFTQSERERLEILRRTFRTQEAQNMVLEKFNTIIEVSQKQAEGLAGSIDRTQQLFGNFAEELAKSSDITNRVAESIRRVNSAFEELLENEDLVNKFGNTLAVFAETGAKALAFMAENIETISMVTRVLLSIFITLTAIALFKLIGSLILGKAAFLGLSKAIVGAGSALRNAKIPRSFDAIRGVLSKLTPSFSNWRDALSKTFPVLARLTGFASVYWATSKLLTTDTDKLAQAQTRYNNTLERLGTILPKLPDSTRSEFQTQVTEAARGSALATRELQTLIDEEERIVQRLSNFRPLDFLVPSFRESYKQLSSQLENVRKRIDEQTGSISNFNSALSDTADEATKVEARIRQAFGGQTRQEGERFLTSLRDEFLPLISRADKFNKELTSLNEIIDMFKGDEVVASALIEMGFTLDALKKIRAELLRADPAMEGFEQMRDTFDDISLSISDATRRLRELPEQPIVSRDVVRQLREMAPEGRARLAQELGVAEENIAFELAKQQLASREIDASVEAILSARQEERKELELINREADELIAIISKYPEQFSTADVTALEAQRLRRLQDVVTDVMTNIRNIREQNNDFILRSQNNTLAIERANLQKQLGEQLSLVRDYVVQRVRLDGELTEATIAEANRMAEATMAAFRRLEKDIEESYGRQLNLTMMAANAMETAFQQFFSDPFEEGLAGLVVSFARAMQQMLAQWMAFEATVGLLNVISPSGTLANRFLGARGMAPAAAASGGYITGPGTSTSDSIPAMLSNGEYVIKASTVDRLGVRNLDALNNMRGFAKGGVVGSGRSGELMGGGDVINNVSIVLNTDGSSRAEEGDQRELGRRIEQAVLSVLIAEKRPGGLLSA